ncbi:MAG: hypothetical protein JRJ69_08275 [Deltaproteobacteria bacterium]|nr:hypothetical protein [Deltaproteobacteria bacterium]MBW1737533.1 hypothetical protein [Deltaproteobacteria bacterium]MBW1910905.1 hypothetical protein [Deltaproteobacteria bacterium]MBW2033800.1 hypothetical protein [Deltaproteobacteria bacterium]MBW2115503.1 hypothetical protein [Deltaproteobacteria bacterium]
MHTLIDKEMVDTIRTTGKTSKDLPDREDILREHAMPYDREAENAIITGCQILSMLPHILSSLTRFLDRKNFSYTFLSEEYCCGNYLYRPAIKARDDEAMTQCRDLSKEFVEKNIRQAKSLGAKRLVIFCSPCYPIYKHAFPEENIVFYPVAIREVMGRVNFEERIDYYAGCYKLHRKFSPVPMDLESTDEVFSKIEGLDVHRISAPKCCFTPEGLSHMTENVLTKLMVHVCTGCYGQALQSIPSDKGVEVLMLPELVERANDIVV